MMTSGPYENVRIFKAGRDRLSEIKPLWAALHAYHTWLNQDVATRDVDDSWRRRRAQYERWFDDGSATLFLAGNATLCGYLMLRVAEGLPTWSVGERIAEVETLSLVGPARGRGIGQALIAAARLEARTQGIVTLSVAVAITNEGARRFYEREGFRPFFVSMLAHT
jgi:GNAT superfamily N-acetyltransferase